MNARITHLKIKIHTLADEAVHIRREERKLKKRGLGSSYEFKFLQSHRKGIVRPAARHNLLAYGYLRGVPYRRMEASCVEAPDWAEVKKLVRRFRSGAWTAEDDASFLAWVTAEPVVQAA